MNSLSVSAAMRSRVTCSRFKASRFFAAACCAASSSRSLFSAASRTIFIAVRSKV